MIMDAVTPEYIDYDDLMAKHKEATAKEHEQEMADLRALYHELSEGTFYEDYDEANRLMGVLRRRLERLDQRPGK
jgi:hypothetical protein